MKLVLNIPKKQYIFSYIKKEVVLTIAALLALLSSIVSMPKLQYIDFKVLILLFNLMIIVAAFENLKILDYFATKLLTKCKSYRSIVFSLTFITFFASMLVTNDVALITFVPLSLIICKKVNISSIKIIVFQTLAANLGSAFTPMGNPQNLFIYSYYNISPINFFLITINLILLSIAFLIGLIIKNNKDKLTMDLSSVKIKDKASSIIFSILFIIILASVFHIIDYKITFIITISIVLIFNKKLFKEIDYSLLLTFVFFFIFIGNISSVETVKLLMSKLLNSGTSTYFSSIILSQFISNVPCTMLLSSFTNNYKELLLGVNIGGMGTLIASMASLISYKLYTKDYSENSTRYIKYFSLYNLLGLMIFIPFIFILNILI
ncbi:SLC13 family permease [Clostridium cibarium]|uniref:Anion transporter n=1 Tax=Clostridium cibarium TaxID=2762247 RepID=A0ABR8PVI4_9CLOT|nr:SLC13 family permease [Clostridium cibarium]MBD7912143.1 anion transporter [Clostridium cibarium]